MYGLFLKIWLVYCLNICSVTLPIPRLAISSVIYLNSNNLKRNYRIKTYKKS